MSKANAATAAVAAAENDPAVDSATARQVRIAQLFKHRVDTGLRTSGAKHALIPPDCLSTETKCTLTQTQAKNNYSLSNDEMANVSVRQNKKRKFYCAAQLDAVSIKKFGFRKFLRKKFRGSAGLKTAEKNLKVMRLLEAKASREEALEAAKYAITFLTLKVENCQAALDEATKQFQVDFPDEAADFIPKPKTDTKLLKKEVQAITSALKIKYKEKLDKMRQAAKEAKKQRKATAKAAAKAKTGRARRTTCAKCGQSDHVRSSKKLCPKYEPRPRKTKAKPAKGPKGATVEVVATAAAPAAKKPRRGKKSNVTL